MKPTLHALSTHRTLCRSTPLERNPLESPNRVPDNGCSPHATAAFARSAQCSGGAYGDRLTELVLYGSQARGDTHAESDVDVLLVLEGPLHPGREIRRMSDVCFDLSLKYEMYLSALPVSKESYRSTPSSWLTNVQSDGVSV